MKEHFVELIRLAATSLPSDVLAALGRAIKREAPGTASRSALEEVVANCSLASESSRPLCQDTGTNIWYVYHPREYSQTEIANKILAATRTATRKSFLRPNAVDSVTGKNSGDNTGIGLPVIHLHEWKRKSVAADLILKGGGSENVSALYALPNKSIGAGRDLDGVRRAVVNAVFEAQGRGCGPGIVGVGIGGDRATSMVKAKEQLFRLLDDTNPDKDLAALEKQIFEQCNSLGIGPMGFGGETTVLGVKTGKLHRLPASYFVAVSYMCWAARRASVSITGRGAAFSEVSVIAKGYNLPRRIAKTGRKSR